SVLVAPDHSKAVAGAGAAPPPDHQDELVDPRHPVGQRDPRAARVDRDRRDPPDGRPERPADDQAGRAGRSQRLADARIAADRHDRSIQMIRRFQLLVVAAILLVSAFSTELEPLFYLIYLAILVIGGSYILTRLGQADLEAGYAVSQLTGHVGAPPQGTH